MMDQFTKRFRIVGTRGVVYGNSIFKTVMDWYAKHGKFGSGVADDHPLRSVEKNPDRLGFWRRAFGPEPLTVPQVDMSPSPRLTLLPGESVTLKMTLTIGEKDGL